MPRVFLLMVTCLLTMIGAIAADQPRAADYAQPSITAWQHKGQGHLTIEWAETARVQQKRNGDRLILRFAKPLGLNTRSSLGNIADFVDVDGSLVQGRDLSLALKPGVSSKVKVREKRIVAVDFYRDPTRQQRSRIKVSNTADGVRLTLDWPGPTRIETNQSNRQVRLEAFPAWDLDPNEIDDLQRSLKPWFHGLRSRSEPDRTKLSFVLEPQIRSSIILEGTTRTVIDFIRDASAYPAPEAGPAKEVFTPQKRPSKTTLHLKSEVAAPPIPRRRPRLATASSDTANSASGKARTTDAGGEPPDALIIEWTQSVGAAVFKRAGFLWAVFDEPDDQLLIDWPVSPEEFGPGSLISVDGGSALRFPLNEAVDINVSQTGEGRWRIEPTRSSGSDVVSIERVDGASALRITPAPGERVLSVIDPDIGDQIDVLPIRRSGLHQPTRRRFVDLELLPTAQGVAWRPLNDRLVATIDERGVELDSPRGLSLSKTDIDPSRPAQPAILDAVAKKTSKSEASSEAAVERPAINPLPTDDKQPEEVQKPLSYFELADSGVERQLVTEYRRIRRQAISKALPEGRDRARIALARLLVSERLATEARTVLNTISEDAEENIVLQKRALGGVSAFLIGHLNEASDLLLAPELNDDKEIDVWRAALNSVEGQWPTAAERWQTAGNILDSYPPRLKFDLGLMALEAAIETDDDKLIRQGIRRLASLPLNPYDKARFDAMKALKAERAGDLEKARALLTGLTSSPNSAIRTLADFRLASLDLDANDNDPATLDSLGRLLPVWRGHPDERAMLDRLARRYRDANALREALTTWRRLVRLFPDAADSDDLTKMRQDTFEQALTNEIEPAIDPLDVYAIYLDFVDLLPKDPGARIVNRLLARHLTDLDLMDEAIDVLQTLMTSADDNVERSELAAEIAGLMLERGRAKAALSVLDQTEASPAALPSALDEERKIIRARALAGLNRADDAIRVLRDMQSNDVRRLRARILWNERSWPRLTAAVESYFAEADLTTTLTDEDQEMVLWLALARQRDNAAEKLNAVRERFGAAMKNGRYAEAFDVATQSSAGSSDIGALLAATGDQLAELRRFREATSISP
ncbi:MAG: hypothetical protein AAGA21_02600 [Pseudomonadota bacterium]